MDLKPGLTAEYSWKTVIHLLALSWRLTSSLQIDKIGSMAGEYKMSMRAREGDVHALQSPHCAQMSPSSIKCPGGNSEGPRAGTVL